MSKPVFPNINTILGRKSHIKLAFLNEDVQQSTFEDQNKDMSKMHIENTKEEFNEKKYCIEKDLLEAQLEENKLIKLLINYLNNYFSGNKITQIYEPFLLDINTQILQSIAKAMYLCLPLKFDLIIRDLIKDFYNKCHIPGAILYVSSKDYLKCKSVIKKLEVDPVLVRNLKLEKDSNLKSGQFKLEAENLTLEKDMAKIYESVVEALSNRKNI